jgi:Tfp pilus assembly protein PilN
LALLESLRTRAVSDLRILSELSALMPETVWLSNVELNDQGIRVIGEAANAAPLLGILSSAQTLDSAAFTSSLVETDSGQRFHVAAQRKAAEAADMKAATATTGATPAAPQANPAANTLSTLGEQESESSGGPQ